MFSVIINFTQGAGLVSNITGNYGNNLTQFAGNIRSTDFIFRSFDHDRFTVGRIQRNKGIMHAFQCFRLRGIYFNDNLFSALHERRRVTHGSSGNQTYFATTQVDNFANFNDGQINITTIGQEAIADILGNHRQMHFRIFHSATVDGITHISIRLIRSTTIKSICFRKSTVQFRSYGSAGVQIDFNFSASFNFRRQC